jgi:voltage-gated potassium channel
MKGVPVSSRLQRRADWLQERATRRPLRVAWVAAAAITLVVTVLAGLLMRLTDPDQFPNLGLGLWWAIQTTTTVGYGDKVPTSVAGRLIAAFVMIVGLGFITVSTAAITSAFIEAARRRRAAGAVNPLEEEMRALRRQMELLTAEVRAGRTAGGPDRPA